MAMQTQFDLVPYLIHNTVCKYILETYEIRTGMQTAVLFYGYFVFCFFARLQLYTINCCFVKQKKSNEIMLHE